MTSGGTSGGSDAGYMTAVAVASVAVVLAVGAGLCLLAYRLMVRIGRLPADRRILS